MSTTVGTASMQFGIDISYSAAPGADPIAAAQRAERLGFDFISTSDHPAGNQPAFETWTMLSWIAARTDRIGIATRVLGVPYRNPAMTAKMAETFDRLSGGRLILGLGGGYSDAEFRAFGLGVPSPREKVDGLAEAIAIIRGLWSQSGFTFTGTHYRTEDADLDPKPARRIPIWLGTFGPRALAVTGRLGDGWIPSLGYQPDDELLVMRERVLTAARAAGRKPDEITCALNVPVHIGERRDNVLSGPATAIVERLISFAGWGFTSFNVVPAGRDRAAQTELLAAEVLPAVRAAHP